MRKVKLLASWEENFFVSSSIFIDCGHDKTVSFRIQSSHIYGNDNKTGLNHAIARVQPIATKRCCSSEVPGHSLEDGGIKLAIVVLVQFCYDFPALASSARRARIKLSFPAMPGITGSCLRYPLAATSSSIFLCLRALTGHIPECNQALKSTRTTTCKRESILESKHDFHVKLKWATLTS